MAETKTGWIYVKKNKKKPGEPGHWSEKKKLEVVTTYLGTGNLALSGRICNVPEVTLRVWAAQDWWKELIAQIQSEGDMKLSSSLEKVVQKSLNQINEIIENGDYIYDSKRGQVVRVPAKLRDVHKLTSDLIDKTMILRKATKNEVVNEESTDGRLLKLAERFASFVNNAVVRETVVQEVIEGDYTELPPEYKDAIDASKKASSSSIEEQETSAAEGGQTNSEPSTIVQEEINEQHNTSV